jgi:tRNA A-37 threonylcarbamoyl transferase component Bud32
LASLGLDGQITASIGDLKYLKWLDFSNNNFTGEIPLSIERLSILERLNLENNMLSGSITSSFGYLSSLGYINLGNNQLSGGIPMSLGYLHFLYHLDLKDNHLIGVIPSSFEDLRKLEHLSLGNNNLTGTIPSKFGDIRSVEYLNLEKNQFSGEIPSSIGDLSGLVYLNLGSNRFDGQIPPSFSKLGLLKELYLADNVLLTGLVPDYLVLILHNINGTSLYFVKEPEDEPTKTESISPGIPDLNNPDEIGESQSSSLVVVIVSSVGAVILAFIGLIVFITRRGTENKRQREHRDEFDLPDQSQSNLYQMTEMSHTAVAENTEQYDSELVFISKVSAGAFGVVWKGTHKGKTVAIKKMKLEKMPRGETKFIQLVINEAKIMRDMPKHDRVVQFIGFDFRTVSIIMELMPRGALSSFISKCKYNMDWSTRYQMMLDICEGMAFLHSTTCADGLDKKELFHQDLKSANVLLLEEKGILRAKIGDFGLSRI